MGACNISWQLTQESEAARKALIMVLIRAPWSSKDEEGEEDQKSAMRLFSHLPGIPACSDGGVHHELLSGASDGAADMQHSGCLEYGSGSLVAYVGTEAAWRHSRI